MNHRQTALLLDRLVLVVGLPLEGIDHHRAVVGANQVLVTQIPQSTRHPFQLPGRCGAAGIPVLPGNVDLQQGRRLRVQVLFYAGQRHGRLDVVQHRLRAGSDHRHRRMRRRFLFRRRAALALFGGTTQGLVRR